MNIDELTEKDDSKEKLILLEAELSKGIISLMWFFSTNSIVNSTGLDKKTVRGHKKGGIPPKYFELYMKALGEPNHPSPEMQKIIKEKPHTLEQCKTIVHALYIVLNYQYEKYRRLVGAAPYLFNKILGKGTVRDDDVLKMLSEQLDKCANSINRRIMQDKIGNLSPQFLYHLNICFDAFSTITYTDTLFLPVLFQASRERQEEILTLMNKMTLNPATDIISCLTSGNGKLWVNAYTHYSADRKGTGPQNDDWKNLKKKIEGKFSQVRSIEEQKNALAFYSFLALIWPKEGETDTNFGTKEIEALIVFKYFLTKEAQQNLLDELQIDYT